MRCDDCRRFEYVRRPGSVHYATEEPQRLEQQHRRRRVVALCTRQASQTEVCLTHSLTTSTITDPAMQRQTFLEQFTRGGILSAHAADASEIFDGVCGAECVTRVATDRP